MSRLAVSRHAGSKQYDTALRKDPTSTSSEMVAINTGLTDVRRRIRNEITGAVVRIVLEKVARGR